MARLRALLYPVFSNLAWGSNFVVGRFLALGGVDAVTLTVLRFLIATPILLALVGWRVRVDRWVVLAGLFGIVLFNLLLYASLAYVSAGAAALFVVMSYPMTYVAELALRVERVRAMPVVGLAMSVAGAYLVLRPFLEVRSLLGPLLALGSAASWTGYTLAVRRASAAKGPVEVLASASLVGLGMLAPLGPLAKPPLDPLPLGLIAYVAVVPGAAAYSAWNVGVARLGASAASATLPLLPLFAILLAWAFLGEAMGPDQLLGAALVLAGLAASVRRG